MYMVEYCGIHKTFRTPVLSGVDLAVERGEILAIVGPSGTGKSVLLKTTVGLVIPDAGDVRVAGDSVFYGGRRSLEWVRRKIGYVFQNAALFDSLTVFENVQQGLPEIELRLIGPAEVHIRVCDALAMVNLDPGQVLGKLPSELSGGMRKRVGLARAIVGQPQILLYDEPTTGLDPMNSTIVHRLIARLREEMAITSLIVTHDVWGVLDICDRMALLEGGHIRFLGTAAEFQASEDPLVRSFLDRDAALPDLTEVV
ncbi:MAG: ATP-binding cassette domain-containing protein [Gemmatimonadota bacterium]|nr:ATP-binding cassette domain-containing protein [Gemmatimonadota bacterium]